MLKEDLESLGEEMRDGELSKCFLKFSFSGGQLPGFIFTQGQNLRVKDSTSETTAYNLGGGQGGRKGRREGEVPSSVVYPAQVSS